MNKDLQEIKDVYFSGDIPRKKEVLRNLCKIVVNDSDIELLNYVLSDLIGLKYIKYLDSADTYLKRVFLSGVVDGSLRSCNYRIFKASILVYLEDLSDFKLVLRITSENAVKIKVDGLGVGMLSSFLKIIAVLMCFSTGYSRNNKLLDKYEEVTQLLNNIQE